MKPHKAEKNPPVDPAVTTPEPVAAPPPAATEPPATEPEPVVEPEPEPTKEEVQTRLVAALEESNRQAVTANTALRNEIARIEHAGLTQRRLNECLDASDASVDRAAHLLADLRNTLTSGE